MEPFGTYLATFPIKPADLGFHGNLFGGTLLAWTDGAAVSFVMKLTGEPRVVTKILNSCFESPVKEGEILDLYGRPNHIGTTSIRIAVTGRSQKLGQAERTVFSAVITFVCIDQDGCPTPISQAARKVIEAYFQ